MQIFRACVVVIFVVFLVSSNAAAKCKWQVKEPAHYQSKDMKFAEANRTVVAVDLSIEEGQYFLGAVYASQFKGGVMQIDSDTPLTMYFEGREPIELTPIGEAKTKRPVLGFAILSKKTTTRFRLTSSQIEELRNNAVAKLRITFKADGEIHHQDYTVKERSARKFSELVNCVMDVTTDRS